MAFGCLRHGAGGEAHAASGGTIGLGEDQRHLVPCGHEGLERSGCEGRRAREYEWVPPGPFTPRKAVRKELDLRLEMRLQFDSTSTEYARTADLMKDWFNQIGLKVTPEAA